MHNFVRECQSHWRKNLLPYIRYVATIPRESLRHKSNTHNIITLHMFISITFEATSIDETNKTESQRLKIYVQNVHHSREHMHSNDYATAQSLMVSVTVSSLGATQLNFLEPGVKVNGDYYRNTVLLNMLLLCFRGLLRFSARWGHQHIVHVTLSPCCREIVTVLKLNSLQTMLNYM